MVCENSSTLLGELFLVVLIIYNSWNSHLLEILISGENEKASNYELLHTNIL